ncbi:hypothetical protein PT015_11445 [Candidatus Mycobacterium wuenschmannii]|uniref:PE-PGRS family protein n=1 Tax=Candidatus Mycobacterium wuenschmannii TaxID=3027808 RepID=A0ABY8W689_9MYCO|nr:hypothetical protein [Candidatus Mycobacterium wuenschmannii]WIM89977.1 hypothetical protein PT015_11445 [Candidatus Mycobacterium wuenschmannii]
MQLVRTTGNHGGNIELRSSGAATRMRACLAGAVAVVGAGLIATNPAATNVGPAVVHRDVQLVNVDAIADLAAATDPLSEWSSVFTEAAANLQAIGTEIQADPLPVLSEVIANQLAFGQTIGSNLSDLASGLNTLFTEQLPAQFQDLITGIGAGDISVSVNNFTEGLLIDLLPGASSLVNISEIPGEIAQNLANVLTNDLSNVVLTGLLSPTAALLGTTQAFADSAQSIVDAFDAGQTDAAFTDLLNIPAVLTGAFLNGYDATDTLGISYAGILSTFETGISPGLLDELLVQLPQEIAQTLAGDGTPATLAADWSALLAEFAPNLAADALSGF